MLEPGNARKEQPMNRLSAVFVLLGVAAGAVAAARSTQATPPASTPPGQYPVSSNAPPSTPQTPSGPTSNGASKSATKSQLQDCVKEQPTSNPAMPESDIEKYCESQLNSAPQR
jgi:hypothetical protein